MTILNYLYKFFFSERIANKEMNLILEDLYKKYSVLLQYSSIVSKASTFYVDKMYTAQEYFEISLYNGEQAKQLFDVMFNTIENASQKFLYNIDFTMRLAAILKRCIEAQKTHIDCNDLVLDLSHTRKQLEIIRGN